MLYLIGGVSGFCKINAMGFFVTGKYFFFFFVNFSINDPCFCHSMVLIIFTTVKQTWVVWIAFMVKEHEVHIDIFCLLPRMWPFHK